MFKIITSLAMSAVGLLANAQVAQTRETKPFHKIEASGRINVVSTESASQAFKAERNCSSIGKSDFFGLPEVLSLSDEAISYVNPYKAIC